MIGASRHGGLFFLQKSVIPSLCKQMFAYLWPMQNKTFTYSFDSDGHEAIYRHEAVIICGEAKVQRGEALATSLGQQFVRGGFDSLYIQTA